MLKNTLQNHILIFPFFHIPVQNTSPWAAKNQLVSIWKNLVSNGEDAEGWSIISSVEMK